MTLSTQSNKIIRVEIPMVFTSPFNSLISTMLTLTRVTANYTNFSMFRSKRNLSPWFPIPTILSPILTHFYCLSFSGFYRNAWLPNFSKIPFWMVAAATSTRTIFTNPARPCLEIITTIKTSFSYLRHKSYYNTTYPELHATTSITKDEANSVRITK